MWADGDRARLGYRDGTVYALRGRVWLSGPLTQVNGQSVGVLAYGQVCGVPFAFTPRGVFRLDPAPVGEVLDSWRRTEEAVSFPQTEVASTRLFKAGGSIYVFTVTGRTAWLRATHEGCEAP